MIIAQFYTHPIEIWNFSINIIKFFLTVYLCIVVTYKGRPQNLLTFDGQGQPESTKDNIEKMKNLSGYLEQLESDLSNFFLLSDDWLVIVDQNGQIVKTNPSGPKELGWSKQDFLSKPVEFFLHPDDVATTRAARASMKQKPVTHFTNRWKVKSGGYRTFEWSATQYNSHGETYAIGREVTNK